jgi:hypothetical protein
MQTPQKAPLEDKPGQNNGECAEVDASSFSVKTTPSDGRQLHRNRQRMNAPSVLHDGVIIFPSQE